MTQTITESRLIVSRDITLLLVRLAVGWIFFYEGAGKLFGLFGGSGLVSLAVYFQQLGIPFARFSAYLVGNCEFIAGLCFILGLIARPAGAVVLVIMISAIFTAHRDGGYNYPMLIGVVCILLIVQGAGRFSLDYLFGKRRISR
jgi:putative oxidoreductase